MMVPDVHAVLSRCIIITKVYVYKKTITYNALMWLHKLPHSWTLPSVGPEKSIDLNDSIYKAVEQQYILR